MKRCLIAFVLSLVLLPLAAAAQQKPKPEGWGVAGHKIERPFRFLVSKSRIVVLTDAIKRSGAFIIEGFKS